MTNEPPCDSSGRFVCLDEITLEIDFMDALRDSATAKPPLFLRLKAWVWSLVRRAVCTDA